jgi:creatinine amidohydrolase
MLLEKMNWMDVEKYLTCDRRIVFVLGSTEQHGYLSLLTDTLIPWEIAKKACESENVLLAPPLSYGYSQLHADYPGTLSISFAAYHHVVQDIVRSALQGGFRDILMMIGHGGNKGAREALYETITAFPDARLWFISWWELPETAKFLEENGGLDHANWSENFPFTRVAEVPSGEIKQGKPVYSMSPSAFRATFPEGIMGGRFQSSDEVAEGLLNTVVRETTAVLRSMNGRKE